MKLPIIFKKSLLLLVLFFILFNTQVFAQNWFNESFESRQTINISNSGTTTLNDFPLYLNITHNPSMQDDFEDIRFTNRSCGSSSPLQLAHEIENYSTSTNAHIWVNVPLVPASGASICMYFNNSLATYSSNSSTWNSNYELVYGFEEVGSSTNRLDSTSNSYNAVPQNFDNDEKVQGRIGYGDNLDGSDDYLAIQSINYNSQSISQLTACSWFNTNFVGSSYNDNWAFLDFDRSEFFNVYIRGDTGAVSFSTNSGGIDDQDGTTTGLNDGSWHYACAVYDGTDKIIYVNGVEDSRVTNAHSGANLGATSTRYGFIGDGSEATSFDGGRNDIYYDGSIDHQRYSTIARSGDWINQSYQLVINQNSLISYGVVEELLPIIDVDITTPLTSVNFPVNQNRTLELNSTISCIDSGSGVGCGEINIYAQYNLTSSSFSNISTISGTIPLWTTSLNPQSCTLNAGENCNISWSLNATDDIGSFIDIRILANSNNSEIETSISDENLTIEITQGEAVGFNQTTLSFPSFKRSSGDRTSTIEIVSFIGTNSDININCQSGDCSEITTSFTNGITLNEANTAFVDFTCSDSTAGIYSAIYNVSSDQDLSGDTIQIDCSVQPLFGPLSLILNQPSPLTITPVLQNTTFRFNSTLNCVGNCGNVSVYATYETQSPFGDGSDGSLVVNSANQVVNDYTYLTGNELSGDDIISVNDASSFSTDDEILIIQMQNNSNGVAGQYEYGIISSISTNDITLQNSLNNDFYSGTFADNPEDSGTSTQVVRIPHYTNLTIDSGSIVAQKWNGRVGGIIALKAQDEILFENGGVVNVSHQGFRGGTCGLCGDDWDGGRGEGIVGWQLGGGTQDYTDAVSLNNVNGGGGSQVEDDNGGDPGAGGGHGIAGEDAVDQQSIYDSTGGDSIGNANLSLMYFGGGGGAGSDNDGNTPFSEDSDGGGIAIITSKNIINASVYSQGEDGITDCSEGFSGNSGAGAGGTIWIQGEAVSLIDVDATGGDGVYETCGSTGEKSGDGGNGRVRLDYTTLTGTPTPSAGFEGDLEDIIDAILTAPSSTPLWSLSPNPQWCMPSIDGSCSFEWVINATGEINELVDISVFAFSNDSRVSSTISNYTTINITNTSLVTLLSPINNEKVVSNISTPLRFRVDGASATNTCSIYINGVLNSTLNCSRGTNTTELINFSSGTYSWRVEVNNSGIISSSSTESFTIIENVEIKLIKTIRHTGTDIYSISLDVNNSLNNSFHGRVFDFVDKEFSAGSFSQPFDSISSVSGSLFRGNLLYWNISLNPYENTQINYSIGGVGNYSLKNIFVGGVE